MEKKITKRMYFENIRAMVENVETVGELAADDVLKFIDKQVALLDKKAETAKNKAAEKRAKGDELRAAVKAVLTDEYQTIDDIMEQIEGEDLTKSKIVSRLTQLFKNKEIVKENIKDPETKRMLMNYKLA